MKQDRFLLGILAAIGVLVIVAVGAFLARRGLQAYGPEDTPEGVVRNYVLALQQGDYQRAYDYVAESKSKPEFSRFQQAVVRYEASLTKMAIEIGETRVTGNSARVSTVYIQSGGGLFEATRREPVTVLLVRQDNVWRLAEAPYVFVY